MESKYQTTAAQVENKGPLIGKRHIQAGLMCLCMTLEISTRLCMSLSIVAMTDNSASSNTNIPTYDWTDTQVILSSFYWGYLILQLPAGFLSKLLGVKWLVFGAMCINSLITVLIPFAASSMGSTGVIICRVFQGCTQGFFIPSVSTLLGRWAPETERSRLTMFIYMGISAGSIFSGPVNGLMCHSYYGWPATFYLFGGLGFAWCILWLIFGYSTPSTHPHITPEEKSYIEQSLSQKDHEKDIPTPWMAIFKSIPFWAVVIGIIGVGWGATFLTSEIPSYLNYVVGYNIETDGTLSSLPTIIQIITCLLLAQVSDYIVEKGWVSTLNSRRIFQLVGCYGSTASMLMLAYLPKANSNLAIIFLIVNGAFGGCLFFGALLSTIDISPRFAGIIMGFSNGLSSAVALFSPLMVQFLVTDESNAGQWRILFILAGAFYFIPATIYAIFASGEVQWWNSGDPEDEIDQRKDTNHEENYSF